MNDSELPQPPRLPSPHSQVSLPPRLDAASADRAAARRRLPYTLQPRPLSVASLPKVDRTIVQIALAFLVIGGLLAIRPPQWGALGGTEFIPAFWNAPRVTFLSLIIGLPLLGALLSWTLLRGDHRLSTLGLIPLGILAASGSSRILSPLVEYASYHGHSTWSETPPDLFYYGLAFRAVRTLAVIAGLLVSTSGILLTFWKFGRVVVGAPISLLALFSFLTPSIAYFAVALGPIRTRSMISASGAVDIPYTLPAASGLEAILVFYALITLVPILMYWQAYAVALLAYEYSRVLASFTAGRYLTIAVAFASVVKLIFLSYGYSGNLPAGLGGNAEIWNFEISPISVVLICGALVILVRFHPVIRTSSQQKTLVAQLTLGSLITVAILTLGAVIQAAHLAAINLVPGYRPDVSLGVPLVVSSLVGNYLAAIVLPLISVYFRQRQPYMSLLLLIAGIVQLPVLLRAAGLDAPLLNGPAFDAAISLAFAGHAVAAVIWRHSISPTYLVLWLSASFVVHSSLVIRPETQLALFGTTLIIGPLYTFFWRGDAINQITKERPAATSQAVTFAAFILLASVLLIYVSDRFGRSDNWAIQSWWGFSSSGRYYLALPILLTLAIASSFKLIRKGTLT